MPISTANFAELEGVIRTIYDLDMKSKPDYVRKLFNVETSSRGVEKHFGIGNMGLMQKWTGTVNYDTFGKRWEQTYRHEKYSNGLTIEREILDDKEYSEIKRRTKLLSHSVWVTKQTHGASVLNNAFDAAYPGADAKPLCSTTHPLSPTDATAQVNTGTSELEIDVVLDTRRAMMKYTDDRGNFLGVNPRLLIVPTDLMDEAKEICQTDRKPDQADWNKNPLYGEMDYVVVPFLTKPKAWWLVDPDLMKIWLTWYNRREPKIEYENNFDTEQGKYKCVGRWSYKWDEWMWCYGHNPV